MNSNLLSGSSNFLTSVGQNNASTSSAANHTRKSIYDRQLVYRKQVPEVNLSAFAFMFSEIVQYTQKKVKGIPELEQKLGELGHAVGIRACEVLFWRERSGKRETKILGILMFINSVVWKAMFGKAADSLEKGTDSNDEYMIIDNEPLVNKFISVPKDLNQLNCGAFMAGVVEGVLDVCQFKARVTAHSTPTQDLPLNTTILIKFDRDVMDREERQSTATN